MRKPDVIGIGFQRCSSSWLHICLSEHPSVGKTPRGIHYFSDHLDKGSDWYFQHFSAFADKKVVLDFSISYTYPENVHKFVENMPRLLPQAKIFAIVRNPVERAFSDYRRSMFREELPTGMTFEQSLKEMPVLLERGRYGIILGQILSVVPEDRVKIFFYDDVKSQPDKLWEEVCEFLGVSSDFTPSLLYTQVHHLAPPKAPKILRIIRTINRGVTDTADFLGLGQVLLSLKRTTIWRKLVDMSVGQAGEISPATRRQLEVYYADDVAFLENLTGRDLSTWLHG